ncbi:MAG: lipid A biosynthesis (KDO)2-(lauroyl)-lipid IVA acyltransferase [Bacteroidales bacterium]|nr:lipid A biosynthesis (KDO)2-(lauroyl)-lipid IVA acyltransferase [Bacteroidales bacterium]
MGNTTSYKWKGVTGGGNFGLKSLFFLFKYCDVRVGYFFMYLTIPFYILFGVKVRKSIEHYFQYVYGFGKIKSFFKTWHCYNTFGKVMLDRFSIFSGQKHKFKVETEGVDLFWDLMKSGKGFMMVGSHTGNFEICGYLLHQDIKKIYALVFGGETQVLQQKRFAQFITNNIEMVAVKDDMSHLFVMNDALMNGNIITMPADRNLGSSKSVTCNFGKATAEFPVGPFSIAAIRDVPVLAVFVYRLKTHEYKVIVKKIEINSDTEVKSAKKKAEMLAQIFVSELEKQVFEFPCQWFNFFEFFNQK